MWAEERGYIYYRKGGGSSGSLGGAVIEVQSLLEPSKRHVIERRAEERVEADDAAE